MGTTAPSDSSSDRNHIYSYRDYRAEVRRETGDGQRHPVLATRIPDVVLFFGPPLLLWIAKKFGVPEMQLMSTAWTVAAFAFGLLLVIALEYFRHRTAQWKWAYGKHIQLQGEIEKRHAHIGELEAALEYNRRQTTDMEGWEALEYMFAHSGLTEKSAIEMQLRGWAADCRLYVEAFHGSDPDPIPVSHCTFAAGKLIGFNLIPRDAALRERFGIYGNESTDGSICGVNDKTWVILTRPRFFRRQVEALCESLKGQA